MSLISSARPRGESDDELVFHPVSSSMYNFSFFVSEGQPFPMYNFSLKSLHVSLFFPVPFALSASVLFPLTSFLMYNFLLESGSSSIHYFSLPAFAAVSSSSSSPSSSSLSFSLFFLPLQPRLLRPSLSPHCLSICLSLT